jgi:2-polyprenyl-6-methoxyphenol hydroxylase-like FAD-dependent oxidoreductase
VILLERRKGVGPSSNHAVALQSNGLAALAQIGALDDLLESGERVYSVAVYDEHHRFLAFVEFKELEHPYPYVVPVLPDSLTRTFRKRFSEKGGPLLEGFELEGLLTKENSVTGVRGAIDGQPMEIGARLVVGADGPSSKVRALSGLRCRVKTYENTFVVAVLQGMSLGESPSRLIIGKGVALGAVSFRGFTAFSWYVPTRDFDRYRRGGLDSLKQRLVELEPDLRPSLDLLRDWSQITFLNPMGVYTESWTKPGLTLLGDAAHAMDPSLGQGLNQSLLDVVALAEVLQECKERDDFSVEALRRYEALRHGQAMFYVKQSEMGARLLTPRNGLSSWLVKRTIKKSASTKRKRLLAMKLSAGLLSEFGIQDLVSLLV